MPQACNFTYFSYSLYITTMESFLRPAGNKAQHWHYVSEMVIIHDNTMYVHNEKTFLHVRFYTITNPNEVCSFHILPALDSKHLYNVLFIICSRKQLLSISIHSIYFAFGTLFSFCNEVAQLFFHRFLVPSLIILFISSNVFVLAPV